MPNLFISYAEEDSRAATQIAEGLKEAGFTSWCFEQDALPGPSYILQSLAAIGESRGFLLLISSDSLASREVAVELVQAHQLDRCIVPVFVNLSHSDLRSLKPDWAVMLGAAASVDLRTADYPSIMMRIIAGIRAMGIQPELEPIPKSTPQADESHSLARSSSIHKTWASDAYQIDVHNLDEVVFRNDRIDDFLNSSTKYFLTASKGLGKTLLLTYKRWLLSKQYQAENPRSSSQKVFFVPEGKPYLDLMADMSSQSKEHNDFLTSLSNAKRLWSFALKFSALSHHANLFDADDEDELDSLPKRLRKWLLGARIEPTVVMKELFSQSVKEINRQIDRSGNFLEYKFRQIHSGMFIFVDKVDQAIRELSRRAWINTQAGLLEAAWDAMSANNHVKVYVTIRQEAFSNYESDLKANLSGATTTIQYTERDLVHLLDQLAQCYEAGKRFKDFIQLRTVRHTSSGLCEDSFKFLHRHTLGRPRDLVIIASELSKRQRELTEPLYRSVVKETSSSMVVANVFNEMRVFLNALQQRDERQRLASLLPRNILSREQANVICCQFNGIERDDLEVFGPDSMDIHHPFWELYNAGLLGAVVKRVDGPGKIQRFKQPHDMAQEDQTDLPTSDFYLIHPALNSLVAKQRRKSEDYWVSQYVLVGNHYPWEKHFGSLVNVEWELSRLGNGELGDLGREALGMIVALTSTGRGNEVREVVGASAEWHNLMHALEAGRHEELYLWFEELIQGTK